jgi:hypothetical protein
MRRHQYGVADYAWMHVFSLYKYIWLNANSRNMENLNIKTDCDK